MDTTFTTTVLGYPRIGPRRELKRAVESYWAGRIGVEKLQKVAAELRRDTWAQLAESLDSVPSNTFSFYDQVLDADVTTIEAARSKMEVLADLRSLRALVGAARALR